MSHAFKSPVRIDPFGGKAYYFDETERLKALDKQPKNSIVFVNGLSDTFGEFVPVETIEHWHSIMEARPWYQFLLCTKRTGLMSVYYRTHKVPENVWVGTTIENSKTAKYRLPLLKSINAKIRWISFEPLLGDIGQADLTGLSWMAVGGETGTGYRPFDVQWARNLKTIAERDKVAFFYEGANGSSDNHRIGGNLLDGNVYQQYPDFQRYP
jgi:protein gp37